MTTSSPLGHGADVESPGAGDGPFPAPAAESGRPARRRKRASPLSLAVGWGLAIFWAVFIWGLGSDGFSMSSTSRFLGPLLEWLVPGLSPQSLVRAMVAIRSFAHSAEYGVFAVLVFRALRLSTHSRWIRAAAGALCFAVALAVADETRQLASDVRTGSSFHVGLDFFGALLALLCLLWLERWRGRRVLGRRRFAAADALETGA